MMTVKDMTVSKLASYIERLLNDKDMASKAAKLGEQIRAEKGVRRGAESLYEEVRKFRARSKE